MAEPLLLLPGILMPARLRYPALISALGDAANAVTSELAVYQAATPPSDYSIELEIAAVDRAADAAGFERFHLYGHSGGGAVAIAYAAARGERLLSLALDEPASDFSPESFEDLRTNFLPMLDLPVPQRMEAFVRRQLAEGVDPPPRPDPPPDWMASRPLGIAAFVRALAKASETYGTSRFSRPVYYSHGSLSHSSWVAMRDRLALELTDFESEEYVGASHLATSHVTEPARVAAALRRTWAKVRAAGATSA